MAALERITAAATRILSRRKGGGSGKRGTANSAIAWDYFDEIPEVGGFADYVSNAMSGATLFAGKRLPDGTVEPLPDNSRAAELVASIAGGPDGQSQMLGEFGTQLAVAGDCFLVIIPDPESDTFAGDRWVVLSTEEVKVQRGGVKATVDGEVIDIPEFDPDSPPDDSTPVAIRVWKPHPRNHYLATSPVLRSTIVLEELRLLNAAVAAVSRSRITGRGVLLVPAGTRFPVGNAQDQAEDSLLDTFIEVASTAILEPESAAATVPIVLEVPGDLISGVKWLQFSSELDSLFIQLRDEAIRRFATGADVPAEVLLGLGDANHWGAWALTAEALRMGAEPRLTLVAQSLTDEWLRPILEAEGDPDAAEALVWWDTSGLRSSSNKGASALEAFKLGIVGGHAARRELGFTEADAPEAGGQSARDDMEGDELPVNETQAQPAQPDTEEPPAAMLATGAVLDSFTGQTEAALAEAVDGLVWTALAVAGRKIMQTPLCPRPERLAARALAATADVHTQYPARSREDVTALRLLDDAWVRVPSVAARYGLDPSDLTAALDDYATALLLTGQPHEFDNVPRLLSQMKYGKVAGL